MSKEIITGAEALMRSLQNEGVKTIFGYPGGAIMPVFDALYDYTVGDRHAFNHVLVRHEQGAAHAAEGYARVSGEVGVCLVTSGPGATNTLTGVADAMMDSTPIVVIAGQVGVSALGTDAFQEVDLVGIAQPISKWSYQIRRPEDIAWAVSQAFYIARSGRPGPVVLDFPKNAQVGTTEWKPVKVTSVRSYEPYPKLDDGAVARAAALINSARRPLALVGQGVELGGAHNELVEFLEKADIPAARTLLGLSALPSGHPLNMGMLGMHGSYAPNVKEQQCDVLIAIGMRFSDRVTGRPQLVCGECNPCKRGQYNVCSNLRVEAFQADGVAQDYFVIPEERVVALPEGMSPDYGAMVEPTAVAAHATSRPRALEGRNVVVSGAGTIGNLVAQFARARGAKRVVITDVSDYRLSKARECGIERTLNVAREPLDGKIAELFGDEGYQVAFECAGVESSVRSLMATVEKGGDVVIVGVHAKDPAVSMFHLGEHELNLIGSMMYRHEDYLKAVEEISAGRIRLAPLVSNRFPLEKYREAYEFIDANRETCMKVLIDLEDGKA